MLIFQSLYVFILSPLYNRCKRMWRKQNVVQKPEVKVNFYQSLSNTQRAQLINEELENRVKFGMSVLDDEVLSKLQSSKEESKLGQSASMIGLVTYNFLFNPHYQDKFQYLPSSYTWNLSQKRKKKHATEHSVPGSAAEE